jgi:hypothetical protein
MFFRCKYLISGMSPAGVLYQELKSRLENQRYEICDVAEAEVLGPYPEPDDRVYSVVPVTFKFETFGYEADTQILFDIFMGLSRIRDKLSDQDFSVGIQEVVVDGDRITIDNSFMLDTQTVEL